VTFQLPQESKTPAAAPNHQMFEVVVPEGVSPGKPFALMANGQKVMVTCPPNVKAGQKIRFQLPIQLSQDELKSHTVDYEMDGWVRCLGQDLKYHWGFMESAGKEKEETKSTKVIEFNVNSKCFVRNISGAGSARTLQWVVAEEYASETNVTGTTVDYSELNNIARNKTFEEKCTWLKNQFNAIRIPWEEGHMKIRVHRTTLLQDAVDAMESIQPEDMKKVFRFEFIGEPALDAGGVAREFYGMVCEQLFNPDCGLFRPSAVNQMCMQINPNSAITTENHLRYFRMAGRVLGKALMDNMITPVHLVQPLYKHMMAWPVSMRDLEQVDDEIYRNLMNLLTMEDVSMLCLDFSVTEDHLGTTSTVDLVPGGADINVENSNCGEYLVAQMQYRLLDRVRSQLLEFLNGFYDVVPEPFLSVFQYQELELLLHGLPNIDMDDWIAQTEYTGEFTGQPNHKVVKWFWEVVREMPQEKKAKLLQFVTGTAGVPVAGFCALQGNDGNVRLFTLHGDKNVKVFPRAHTCFNRLDFPMYKTKEELKKYVSMAVEMESTGFGIE
jgi:E3 ubiquitin-protein ligase NEDD4